MSKNVLANSRKANSFTTSEGTHESKRSSTPKLGIQKSMQATSPKYKSPDPSPLEQPTYFSSAYETLIASFEDEPTSYTPIHDYIDAYHTFNARIRNTASALSDPETQSSALNRIRVDSRLLVKALCRDLQVAFLNPFGSSTKGETSEYQCQRAQALSTLCQTCLGVVSSIFALPTLHRLFTDEDLGIIFGFVVDIAKAEDLRLPSPLKIRRLASWVIQTQSLSGTVVQPQSDKLALIIQKTFSHEEAWTVLDAMKMIHGLLKSPGLGSVPRLVDFLPQILQHLCADDAKLRLHAAHALSGFALSKLSSTPTYPHDTVKEAILKFIETQSDSTNNTRRMPTIVSDSFASGDRLQVAWCIIVAACIIVLLEDTIFTHPKAVKFCAVIFEGALRIRSITIQKLHSAGWRAFVWAFTRLLPTIKDNGPKTRKTVDRSLALVAEELKDGIGVELVGVLLAHDAAVPSEVSSANITRAIKTVTSMVAGEKDADPKVGLLLLRHLTSGIGIKSNTSPSTTGMPFGQPPMGLFNGLVQEGTDGELRRRVAKLDSSVDLMTVRKLLEAEVKEHWEELMTAWLASAERVVSKDGVSISKALLDVWQSLLLSQGEVIPSQASSHLLAPPTATSRIASCLVQLCDKLEDANANDQQRRLLLVQKLFKMARNVYSSSWAPGPAQVILAALLERPFDLTDQVVKEAWTKLCQDAVSAKIPTLLHVISVYTPGKSSILAQKQLWLIVAKEWSKPDAVDTWEELVPLLHSAFRFGKIGDEELRAWRATLGQAISMAKVTLTRQQVVIQRILEAIGIEVLLQHPDIVEALLAHVDPSELWAFPHDIASLIDRTLCDHYPPRPEDLSACLNIISRTAELMTAASPSVMIQFLATLQRSLQLWIVDDDQSMLSVEYTRAVQTFYCDVLSALRRHETALETLLAISPFLVTVFSARHSSGAVAFQDFWRDTYHGIERYRQYYPPDLKTILLSLTDVYGGSLADGLSMGSESQVIAMTTVLDSQSPPMRAVGEASSDILPQSLLGAALLASSPEHQHQHHTHTPQRRASECSSASTAKRRHAESFPDQGDEGDEHGREAPQEALRSPESLDEDTQTRKRRRISSWVASTSFIGPSMLSPNQSQPGEGGPQSLEIPNTPSPLPLRAAGGREGPSEAGRDGDGDGDFDDWERRMSSQEVEEIRKDLIL